MKRFFFFLLASISFQAPILSRGCLSYLESEGFYKNKYVGSYYEAKYAFRGLHPEEQGATNWPEWEAYRFKKYPGSWINCDLSKHNDGGNKPFDNGYTYCNGKLFLSGIPSQNYNFNAVYDKNGEKWSAFRGSGIENNPYYKNVSECYFDSESKSYYEIVDEDFDLFIPKANKKLWIKLKSYNFYEQGVQPSF